jgi:mycothiol synthase
VVGSGLSDKSDLAGHASITARVFPGFRRRGIGTALLKALDAHAVTLGFPQAVANADDEGSAAFAERFGFREIDRQIEQVRNIGEEPPPVIPDGVAIVSVAERPELWSVAYETVAAEAFQDMAVVSPVSATAEEWAREWMTEPAATFLALAGDEVIGCAGLLPDTDEPHRAENALTAVRRNWRGRGVAAALKRVTLAWAASHGITEVYTWTQIGNADMRRLNEHLGYFTRTQSITMRADLPLRPSDVSADRG